MFYIFTFFIDNYLIKDSCLNLKKFKKCVLAKNINLKFLWLIKKFNLFIEFALVFQLKDSFKKKQIKKNLGYLILLYFEKQYKMFYLILALLDSTLNV